MYKRFVVGMRSSLIPKNMFFDPFFCLRIHLPINAKCNTVNIYSVLLKSSYYSVGQSVLVLRQDPIMLINHSGNAFHWLQ